MVLALHGVAGGWDELLIAVAAFGVLWVTVKIAGRKSADDGEETDGEARVLADEAEPDKDPVRPPTSGRR